LGRWLASTSVNGPRSRGGTPSQRLGLALGNIVFPCFPPFLFPGALPRSSPLLFFFSVVLLDGPFPDFQIRRSKSLLPARCFPWRLPTLAPPLKFPEQGLGQAPPQMLKPSIPTFTPLPDPPGHVVFLFQWALLSVVPFQFSDLSSSP